MNYKIKHRGYLRQSPIHIGFCLFIFCILFIHCSDNGVDPEPQPEPTGPSLAELRQDLAVHYANNYILNSINLLNNSINELENSNALFQSTTSLDNLEGLRNAVKEVWMDWQNAAIYQMGPTETNALRAALNIYPTDENKIENLISAGTWNLSALSNNDAVGLPAIDYLINNSALTNEELLQQLEEDPNRRSFLNDQINGLQDLTTQVADEWNNGTFIADFISASSNGTDVGSALGLTINAIDLHVQRYLRDGKVAIPAGIRSAGVARPLAVEAFHGGYSRELLETAIIAYIELLDSDNTPTSDVGTSLEDYLNAIDQGQIADDIIAAFENALTLTQALDPNLKTQIETDNDKMIELFMAIQEAVTLIKSDMSSVMGITITNQDNDGD